MGVGVAPEALSSDRHRSRLVGLYNSLEGIAQHYILPQITISLVIDPSLRLAA